MRDFARRGLAVGFFDGAHLGHQAILERASAALTFKNHPLSVLAPEKEPRLLMTADRRIAAIRSCGVEKVIALDFTRELAELPAEVFARERLSAAAEDGIVFCGENWRFGRGGEGDASLLRSLGFSVEVVPYAVYGGERISSTRIRAALEAGKVKDANAMLGREWSFRGVAFQGKGIGSGLGYPTVNFRLDGLRLDLMHGVYEVSALGVTAIANYGVAPTFGENAWDSPVLELHFIDTVPQIAPGDETMVSFRRFIRPERRFSSVEELRAQIAKDIGR